jgi:hypothetical protein
MRLLVPLLILVIASTSSFAQDLGDIKLSVMDHGNKKFRDADRRVFVAGFNVHYQTHFSLQNTQRSKNNGRRQVAGSRVVSNIGLGGLKKEDLTGVTDAAYRKFRDQLTAAGYTFIELEEAVGIEALADWERVPGGSVSQAQVYGYATVTPSELDILVPRIRNSGRRTNKFIDPSAAISKQLDNAIVAFVDVYVPFAEDGESGWSRSLGRMTDESKVVIRTNLRLGMPTVAQKGNFAESVGLGMNPGSLSRGIRLASGKVGLGTLASYAVTLKKDLPIEGVMTDEKIKSYARGESHSASMFDSGVYFLDSQQVEESRSVDYDKAAYLRGVELATTSYIKESLAGFVDKAK